MSLLASISNALKTFTEIGISPDDNNNKTIATTDNQTAAQIKEQQNAALQFTAARVAVVAYPPRTHDALIQKAFPNLHPTSIAAIQYGSRDTDTKYNNRALPVTLIESNAPKHAMTPGSKIKEFIAKGYKPEKAESEARTWAKAEAQKWIDSKGEEAKAYMRQAFQQRDPIEALKLENKAYEAFGHGAHTLMDNISPAHNDFQIFYGLNAGANLDVAPDLVTGVAMNLGLQTIDELSHVKGESHIPSELEINTSNEVLRNYYKNVFGEAALRDAVGGK